MKTSAFGGQQRWGVSPRRRDGRLWPLEGQRESFKKEEVISGMECSREAQAWAMPGFGGSLRAGLGMQQKV